MSSTESTATDGAAETGTVDGSRRLQTGSVVCDVDGLSKVYFGKSGEPVLALNGISATIQQGEVLAVIGPSGCGKSTLLRVLAGLDRDYEGAVHWHDRGASGKRNRRLASATVFQSESLFPWQTVGGNVELPLKPLGCSAAERRQRSDKYLTMVGLRDFRSAYPHELSGGMKQRAALARALAADPLLLLLDEPFAALDAQSRLIMQQELLTLFAQTSTTVLYVTHDIEEAVTLADRVVVMTARPGRIRHVQRIDIPRDAPVMSVRATAEFRRLTEELWTILAAEVGDTLASQTR